MQVQDKAKKCNILEAARKLFSEKQFHKVCLDEVAAQAGVGKGTLYTYFESKEDIYLSLMENALCTLVENMQTELDGKPRTSAQKLELIVTELVNYAASHPKTFELIRSGGASLNRPRWKKVSQTLTELIEEVLKQGNKQNELTDPMPRITAYIIPGMVRSIMRDQPEFKKQSEKNKIIEHILKFIRGGLDIKN